MNLNRLKEFYFDPVRHLLNSPTEGNIFAAAALLLCAMDFYCQASTDRESSADNFSEFWKSVCPVRSKTSECKRYEFYPSDKNDDAPGKIMWAIYRNGVIHNGGYLTDYAVKGQLGNWSQNEDIQILTVDRSTDRPQNSSFNESPVFGFDTKDKKLIFDPRKLLEQIEGKLVNVRSGDSFRRMTVTVESSASSIFNHEDMDRGRGPDYVRITVD